MPILRSLVVATTILLGVGHAAIARAQAAPIAESAPAETRSYEHTRWGFTSGTQIATETRGVSAGLDFLGRYGIVEAGIRADVGPLTGSNQRAFGLLGAVAGVRLPIGKGTWSAWSLHLLAEGGADFTWANDGLVLRGLAPPGDVRVSSAVPYVGLRVGAEWRLGPKWGLGPTLGLWTYARTDTQGDRTPTQLSSFGSETTYYTLVRGGQSDVGVGVRLGFEIGR